jgi:hypothetical protein
MKYQFRPYAKMQPTEVTLTGNFYEKGEHPIYTEHKIIEVVDKEGEVHYAFEDELTSDEVEEKEISYSEEELKSAFKVGFNIGYGSPVQELDLKNEHCEKWFNKFKNK